MSDQPRKILVTSALPYANGDIHIGHLVEYIQTDIWVRHQRMSDHEVYYLGADDAHGTPIMIKAQKEGITPEQLVAEVGAAHQCDFANFLISFDHYYSTHSPENRQLSELIYQRAKAKGLIVKRSIDQAFDTQKHMFLPDRMIKGTCPKCHSPDQYGDNCEVCGATYNPSDLLDPKSALSDTTPEWRPSEHYFFDLPQFNEFLNDWTQHPGRLQKQVFNKLKEWFDDGLKQWDISRDVPYFGFEIPDTNGEKYFYVWLDAPVGYMASFKHYCDQQKVDFDEFWHADSTTELHHFIGKDIVYFHALFWPAMLKAADFRLPTKIHAHGFLTVNGQKMSKSRGTFLRASTWAKHLPVDPLRYFFASRMANNIDDLDLDLQEFRQKFNTDIVGKVVNIASRCSGFLANEFDNHLCELHSHGRDLLAGLIQVKQGIRLHYEEINYSHVVRLITDQADQVNSYINHHQPWKIAKKINQEDYPKAEKINDKEQLQQILSASIQAFAVLITYLKPILPKLAAEAENFLKVEPFSWNWSGDYPLGTTHQIAHYHTLAERIQQQHVDAMIESEKTT